MDEFNLAEWACNDPVAFLAVVLAVVSLAFLVGVFAATVEWVWGLWKGRKEK